MWLSLLASDTMTSPAQAKENGHIELFSARGQGQLQLAVAVRDVALLVGQRHNDVTCTGKGARDTYNRSGTTNETRRLPAVVRSVTLFVGKGEGSSGCCIAGCRKHSRSRGRCTSDNRPTLTPTVTGRRPQVA
jgi:hypothetical protein